ncbi:MAG: branched-chain amino acid ABC transporter permease [Thermoflavifilum sp.]|nr:branched-chain amino acid ABC transporter permease [Thermoflavifilum sp.]MCL6513593.1 branched-chain amino acid ABC transporter permease [Alicyclobacillus sp.]
MKPQVWRRAGVSLLLVLGLALPLVVSNGYYQQVIVLAYIWAIATYGMNIILGYTGLLSLGQAGFFGVGAYTAALLMLKLNWNFWPALLAALVVSLVLGYLVAIVSLRTRGHYFAIFTMAVGVILNLVIDRWNGLTNGEVGLVGVPGPGSIGPVSLDSDLGKYYVVYVFLVVAVWIAWSLRHSLPGRALLAIRNSEDLAEAIGTPVMRFKRLAFVLSTAFAGVAGALFAGYMGYLGPDVTSINMTFNMLLYLLIGGIGSIAGPLLGALIVSFLTQFLQIFQDYQMLIFGPVLVLLIIFFPGGLASVPRLIRRRRARDHAAAVAMAEAAAIEGSGSAKEGA